MPQHSCSFSDKPKQLHTVNSYLGRILSYHLGFSFPINTVSSRKCLLPFFISFWYMHVQLLLLPSSKSHYISYQLVFSKLRGKRSHHHPGGLQSLDYSEVRKHNTEADKLSHSDASFSLHIQTITKPLWFYLAWSKRSISVMFTIVLLGRNKENRIKCVLNKYEWVNESDLEDIKGRRGIIDQVTTH